MSMRLIDADALLESGICAEYGYNDNGLLLIPMRDVTNSIRNAPTIDAEPVRHGRWIRRKSCHTQTGFVDKCSVCQNMLVHLGCKANYCPNCGAKMDGEADWHTKSSFVGAIIVPLMVAGDLKRRFYVLMCIMSFEKRRSGSAKRYGTSMNMRL